LPAAAENPVPPAQAFPHARDDGSATQAPSAGSARESAQTASDGLLGLHSNLRFMLLAAPRKQGNADIAAFQAQVKRVSARLQGGVRIAYPEAFKRVGAFDVYVADTEKLSALSSASGKIAVSAGFARLKPTDAWMAFVISREMGHVIARHHDSNAGASIAVSVVMNLIVPGSGLAKSVLSLGGSEIASGSQGDKQGREADEVALRLLAAAGYGNREAIRKLRLKPVGEDVSSTFWAADFRSSVARLAVKPPRGAFDAPAPRGEPVADAPQAILVSWQPGYLP
jgi:hypothetical protein